MDSLPTPVKIAIFKEVAKQGIEGYDLNQARIDCIFLNAAALSQGLPAPVYTPCQEIAARTMARLGAVCRSWHSAYKGKEVQKVFREQASEMERTLFVELATRASALVRFHGVLKAAQMLLEDGKEGMLLSCAGGNLEESLWEATNEGKAKQDERLAFVKPILDLLIAYRKQRPRWDAVAKSIYKPINPSALSVLAHLLTFRQELMASVNTTESLYEEIEETMHCSGGDCWGEDVDSDSDD